jgi:hypothetical protein
MQGQANTISLYDRQTGADIRQLHERIANAQRLDDMQFIEAEAAVLNWAALALRAFPFTQRDGKAVPLHWRTIGTRVSPLTNSPRRAITPFHSMLNYLYALLEGETSIALRVMEFDSSLRILHTDQEYRRSFAHDVMEAARPAVDSWLLATIAARPFSAKDFSETRDGECRLTVAIRRLLSETIPLWRKAVAPIVEQIAVLLAGNALPTSLTQEKRSASRPQNNGTAKPKRQEPITIARTCKRCGEIVPKERRVFCSDACRIAFQGTQLTSTIDTLNCVQVARPVAPEVPSIDTPPLPADYTLEQYRNEIAPALARVPVASIRRATGLSYAYCKRIRRGDVVPHVVHWAALQALVKLSDEASRL